MPDIGVCAKSDCPAFPHSTPNGSLIRVISIFIMCYFRNIYQLLHFYLDTIHFLTDNSIVTSPVSQLNICFLDDKTKSARDLKPRYHTV